MIRAIVSRKDLKRMTDHIVKNVRWASVTCFNEVGAQLQQMAIADLKTRYTIRSRWVPGSIKFSRADKRDKYPTATVGSIQPFMGEHEVGSKRHTTQHRMSIPILARQPNTKTTRPATWPNKLLGRDMARRKRADQRNPGAPARARRSPDKYFLMQLKGDEVVVQRVSRGRRIKGGGRERDKLKFWWRIRKSVTIKPDWKFYHFVPIVGKMVMAAMPKHLTLALRH